MLLLPKRKAGGESMLLHSGKKGELAANRRRDGGNRSAGGGEKKQVRPKSMRASRPIGEVEGRSVAHPQGGTPLNLFKRKRGDPDGRREDL